MHKNTKQAYTALAIIIVIAGLIWLFRSKPAAQTGSMNAGNSQQNSQNPNPSPTPSNGSGVWTGTLKASDRAAKGNIMLVTKDRSIYMRTSRDFSSMYGKKVDVSYQGSLQSFVLGNITLSATQ